MMTDVYRQAYDAGLSPLLTRIAVILSSIDGDDSAEEFIQSVRGEIVNPLVDEEFVSLKRRKATADYYEA